MEEDADPNALVPPEQVVDIFVRYATKRELDQLFDKEETHTGPGVEERTKDIKRRVLWRRLMLLEYVPVMCHIIGVTQEVWERWYHKEDHDHLLAMFVSALDRITEISLERNMEVSTVKTMLKQGDFSIDTKGKLRKLSQNGLMEHEKRFAIDKGYAKVYMDAMDRNLDNSCSATFALDLASGAGAFPFEYCYRSFHSDNARIFTWHTSEYRNWGDKRNPLAVLRCALGSHTFPADIKDHFKVVSSHGYRCKFAAGAAKIFEGAVEEPGSGCKFVDPTGHIGWGAREVPLYPNHRVRLVGLSSEQYNNKRGITKGKDPKNPKRIAVLVDGKKKPLSFKTKNLLNLEPKAIANHLIFRSMELDLEHPASWIATPHIRCLPGKCAVVTCTSLLTEVGPTSPELWKQVMRVAAGMLDFGGILVQHDTTEYGGFGDEGIMKAFIQSESIPLKLVECSEPIKDPEVAERMLLLVWKRTA